MKTLNQLEQEAQQAREEAIKEVSQYVPNAIEVTDKLILAAVAMVTYQFALGMAEIGGDRNIQIMPEVSQDERDSDGFIKWGGGEFPVGLYDQVDYKLRDGTVYYNSRASLLEWRRDIVERSWDIVAYRVVKGE